MGGVQIRTAGVRKCRSQQIVLHDLLNMLERSNGHTPGVQGATGLRCLAKLVYTQATKSVQNQMEAAVQIRTAVVQKCRLLQIVCHGLVNMIGWSNGHTPGLQGATGPPSLVQLEYSDLLQL